MRIELDDTAFEVEAAADVYATMEKIRQHPSYKSAIAELAEQAYFRRFENDGSYTAEYAENVMEAFVDGGGTLNAAEDEIIRSTDDVWDVDDAYRETVSKTSARYHDLSDAIMEALRIAHPDADDEIETAVEDALRDDCIDRMIEKDDSKPLDTIPRHAEVEMCFIPGYADGNALEDLWIQHLSQAATADNVIPDEKFAHFLRFVNVSSDDYVAKVLEMRGIDVRAEPNPDDFRQGAEDIYYARALRHAKAWRDLDVKADPERPVLLAADEVVTVVENAGGGVPVFACRMPVLDFLQRDHSKPMVVKDGGFVGIHDFMNGAGYIEVFKGELTLPANSIGNWVVANKRGYGIDSVYGIVESYLRVKIADARPTEELDADSPEADAEDEAPAPRM